MQTEHICLPYNLNKYDAVNLIQMDYDKLFPVQMLLKSNEYADLFTLGAEVSNRVHSKLFG